MKGEVRRNFVNVLAYDIERGAQDSILAHFLCK